MSHPSSPHGYRNDAAQPADAWAYEYPAGYEGYAQHPAQRPQRSAQHHQPRRKSADDYTLMHGRRQVRLGPVAFWFVIASLVIMAGWSVLTGTYFAFQDDVLKRLI